MKTPFKPVLIPVLAGLIGLSASGLAQAQQERARVISSTPIVQQIAVPRNVCYDETVSSGRRIGSGAIIGGIAGGAVGNAIGSGSGNDRALATMIGLVGGAVVGNHIEGRRPHTRTEVVRHCTTQTQFESRTVGYDVVYRYAGRNYQMQMPQQPGRFVRVNVTSDYQDDQRYQGYQDRPQYRHGRQEVMQVHGAPREVLVSPRYEDEEPVGYRYRRDWR